jgi:16S rRNA (adenine1518-N6/adenine1519-N6)-dimethyltransferase
VLVQKEYAARLAAAPGTEDYGSLTVFARYYLRLEPLFHVPPGAFWPKPLVESTLVRLRFRADPPVDVPDEERLFTIVRAAFSQRRKTLANALQQLYGDDKARVERLLRAAHVAGNRRGETLDLEEFARIARHDEPYREETEAAG